MIIVMSHTTNESALRKVTERLVQAGILAHVSHGENRTIIGVVGDKSKLNVQAIEAMEEVEKIVHIAAPYKLANRDFHPEPTIIQVGDLMIGGDDLVVMAGPCSVENRENLLEIAHIVKKAGAHILRGGAFKPRTSPYSFQGMGEEGLKILAEAREQTGLKIISEVMDSDNLEMVAEYVDILQLGARNMQNFHLLKEIGKTDKPVLLKRGLSATIEEWLMSAEYIMSQGNHQVILCERGIRTFETYTRNTLDLSAIPIAKYLSHLPVIVDPSHGVGKWRFVSTMAKAGVVAGADGIIIEVHQQPDKAMSDGYQSLNPNNYKALMEELRQLAPIVGKTLQ
ncbi:MAG: 3-deoxy-7-phosphoheptulonate synthase [Bacilli bacterium]